MVMFKKNMIHMKVEVTEESNMKKEIQDEFYKKYPHLFHEKDMSIPCQARGLWVGDGWEKILDDLCKQLTLIYKATGIQTTFVQIKEKFGTLRAYHDTFPNDKFSEEDNELWRNIIDSIVGSTEYKSSYTCEVCGQYGTIRKGGWLKTLCGKHVKKETEDEKEIEES